MADKYWSTISRLTGMPYCPHQGPFIVIHDCATDGSIIGVRHGFIVAIAATFYEQQFIKIYVRYPAVKNTWPISEALGKSPQLLAALKLRAITDQQLKEHLLIQDDYLMWTWKYIASRTDEEVVVAVMNALTDTLKGVIPDFQGQCEDCHTATPPLVLMNSIPGYHCLKCQSALERKVMTANLAAAAADHAAKSDRFQGVLAGMAATAACAVGWGVIAAVLDRRVTLAELIVGGCIAHSVKKAMGHVDSFGKACIFVFTLLSVIAGDFLYFVLNSMERNHDFTFAGAINYAVAHFWPLWMKGASSSIFLALLGAGAVVYLMRRQTLSVTFAALDADPTTEAASAK